jgi:hypothetical protein
MIQAVDLHRDLAGLPLLKERRFESETGVKVLTVTPKPTQHTHVNDPRTAVVDD